MSKDRLVGLIAAAVVLIAVVVGGIYAYQRKAAPPAPGEPSPTAEKKQEPSKPESAPAPQSEAKKTETPKPAETPKPTSVPTFDVVRVEQSGEGVIAGRAEPGWTVKLESGGTNVAETKVDEEGAWIVVLEKPLPAGSHTLTLRAMSPDGAKVLTAQQGVQVAVGPESSEPKTAERDAPAESGQASPQATPPAEPPAAPEKAPDVAAKEPEIAPEAVPAPPIPPSERPTPAVRIKKVDYVDVGSDSGKITMSGVGDSNATLSFFLNDAPVGQAVIGADGNWSYEIEKRLGEGDQILRVDRLDEAGGMIGGRASVTLRRAPETAAREPAPAAPDAETPAPAEQPKPETATSESAPPPAGPPVAEKAPDVAATEPEIAPEAVPAPPIPPSERPKPPVRIKKVDYVDIGSDSGKITISGIGDPGGALVFFFDDAPVGEAVIGSDGNWSHEVEKRLVGDGDHIVRVDKINPDSFMPAGRAEVTLRRAPEGAPAPAAPSATPPPQPEQQVAAREEATAPAAGAPADLSSQPQPVYPSDDRADAEAKPDTSDAGPESKPEATTEIAKTEPEAPVVPLQPVYPSRVPDEPARVPFPKVTVPPYNLSSQPQPVYPKREEPSPQVAATEPSGSGTAVTVEEPAATPMPPPSVAAPSPSEAAPSAEPPSVATQPQPVVPKEEPQPEAKPEPSAPVAAAEPPAAPAPSESTAPSAADEESDSTKAPDVAAAPSTVTAETPGTKRPEAELPKVVFNSVDYAEAAGETGSMALTGTGDPGARIHLFLNNHPLGETTVGEDGGWSFETSRKLHPGQHNIRADQLEAGGTVVASASIGMERVEKPVPPEEPVAAQQPPAAPAPATPSPSAKETETAAAEADKPAAEESKPRRVRSRNYTVQKGDTLWDIAEDFYGGGWRFKAIVRGNRNKIRNPHWIYPDQQFRMPDNP